MGQTQLVQREVEKMNFGRPEQAFEELDRRYAELKRLREAEDITEQEFDEQRQRLMARDAEGRWWAKLGESGEWHYRDGKTWVRGTPPYYQEEEEEEAVSEPTNFEEADRRYARLKGLHEAGTLTDEEFDEQLRRSMVQDQRGRWWVKSRKSGEWHYHDGRSWVKGTPPGYSPPTPAVARSSTRRGWLPPRVTLPAAVVAGIAVVFALFFVYGYVRADASDLPDLTEIPQRLSNEAGTPSEEEEDPTATASSPSLSPILAPSPSTFLSAFLSTPESPYPSGYAEQSPPTAPSPSPSAVQGEGACLGTTNAEEFAESLDFGGAEELARYLGLTGGKDELARILRECDDLDDLAVSLGFSTPERLAAYLGFEDGRELTTLLGSATKDDGKYAIQADGGAAAIEAAGADEKPSSTRSDQLLPASNASPPPPPLPPPPPPKTSELSPPPPAEEPPPATDGSPSPPTGSEAPSGEQTPTTEPPPPPTSESSASGAPASEPPPASAPSGS